MARLSIAWIVLSLLGRAVAAPPSPEEQTERARIHLKAAIAYYDEARYEDAAREMESAYALKPLPDLQYNLAQCYERLGRYEPAAKAYETYLAHSPTAPDRSLVETRIANLRERAQAVAAGQQAPPPPPTEKIVLKTVVVYKEKPAPPGRYMRYAAVGVAILGLGALASGVAFSVLATQAANSVTTGGNVQAPPTFDGAPRAAQDQGRSYPIIAGVSYGVAGLCALGGIGLFLLGRKVDKEAPRYSLAPSVTSGGVGLSLAGRF